MGNVIVSVCTSTATESISPPGFTIFQQAAFSAAVYYEHTKQGYTSDETKASVLLKSVCPSNLIITFDSSFGDHLLRHQWLLKHKMSIDLPKASFAARLSKHKGRFLA